MSLLHLRYGPTNSRFPVIVGLITKSAFWQFVNGKLRVRHGAFTLPRAVHHAEDAGLDAYGDHLR